jgi:hypothetical protein
MIRWTPPAPATPPQRWQSRAEIAKTYLGSLSPDELLRVRPHYWALRFGPAASASTGTKDYNPDQPRVPAGNPDGGQWTSDGDGVQGAVFVDASDIDQSGPNPFMPDLRYVASGTRITIDIADALTGIDNIDETTKALSETLAHTMQTMDFIPEWTPQKYGTAVHVAFGTAVRLQGLPGISFSDVEHSFGGDYGDTDSIRTDVVRRNDSGDVIVIYDVKTLGATLKPARVKELRAKTGVSPNVPIIELHVTRGARLKGKATSRSVGTVIARKWSPAFTAGT